MYRRDVSRKIGELGAIGSNTLAGAGALFGLRLTECLRAGRQEYGNDRSALAFDIRTPDAYVALVLGDNALQNPKPKAGSLLGFGSEEGFKYSRINMAGNATPGVCNREAHTLLIVILPV
jgi:hypothetical protein